MGGPRRHFRPNLAENQLKTQLKPEKSAFFCRSKLPANDTFLALATSFAWPTGANECSWAGWLAAT